MSERIVPSGLAHVLRLRLAVGEVDPPGVRSPPVGRARQQGGSVRGLAANQAHGVVAEAVPLPAAPVEKSAPEAHRVGEGKRGEHAKREHRRSRRAFMR
jgi:hypothetical protein